MLVKIVLISFTLTKTMLKLGVHKLIGIFLFVNKQAANIVIPFLQVTETILI